MTRSSTNRVQLAILIVALVAVAFLGAGLAGVAWLGAAAVAGWAMAWASRGERRLEPIPIRVRSRRESGRRN
jgi:hypothetical protein